MILETKRLLLREMIPDDFQALLRVLGDPETMWHYPYTFDGQHVRKTHVYIGWVPIESVLYGNEISIQEIGQ
jgi:RimJ/RimL family protein N-acetyltransferase